MPNIFRRRAADGRRRRAQLRAAVADDLEISRSPLRYAEPGWFVLAEDAAWERVRMLTGLAAGAEEPGATLAEGPALGRPPGLTGQPRAERTRDR
jgi:hypothetical protein